MTIDPKGQEKAIFIDEYFKMLERINNIECDTKRKDALTEQRIQFYKNNNSLIPEKLYYYTSFANKHNVTAFCQSKLWLSFPDKFNDPNDSKIIKDISESLYGKKLMSGLENKNINEQNDILNTELCGIKKNIKRGKEITELHNAIIGNDNENLFRKYQLNKMISNLYNQKRYILSAIEQYKKDKSIILKDTYQQYMTYIMQFYIDKHEKEWGICSFSDTNNDMLMWSHYADNHRGICLEYSRDEILKHFYHLLPIIYDKPITYGKLLDKKQNAKTLDDIGAYYLQRFLYKTKEWAYENEWRVLSRYIIPNKDKVIFNNINGFLSKKIEPTAIYLGNNINDTDIDFIKEYCKEKNKNEKKIIKLYQKQIENNKWEFSNNDKQLYPKMINTIFTKPSNI